MAATVIIPARLGSSRFPGKIIAAQTGRPLVQHVVDQVRKCKLINEIIVAADDERVAAALRPFGTRVVMTDPNHPSGTDRIAEVAQRLNGSTIINVQGDEPEIEPETVDRLAYLMQDEGPGGYEMWTVATPFAEPADPHDPNLVKVVFSQNNRALYFSRSLIPYRRDRNGPDPTYYLHVGIYAYRRDSLLRLAGWKPTPGEMSECLEQLRALEHDMAIGVSVSERSTHGIDTPEQYASFVRRVGSAHR